MQRDVDAKRYIILIHKFHIYNVKKCIRAAIIPHYISYD
jgi:hypothetical protein